jgi:Acetyltransferase (GNAT) domain
LAQGKPTLKVDIVLGRRLLDVLSECKENQDDRDRKNLVQELEWFIVRHQNRLDLLGAYVLRGEDGLCGFAFFLLQDRPLLGYLGEFKIFSLPLKCVRFVAPPQFPEESPAYDQILESVKAMKAVDGLYLRALRVDSFFWNYLNTNQGIRKEFLVYLPNKPSEHYLISLPASFEEYMHKFAAKTRSNLRRSLRKLQKDTGAEVRLSRITAPEQVDSFVGSAFEISRKTYQWHIFGSGLRWPEALRRNLRFLAERGWLRCYLLWCGKEVCAFMICHQRNGVCHSPTIGYDPRWERFSAGTILQLLVIEDLFTYDRPALFDFGSGAGAQKEFFGNTHYLDADIYLLRRRAYAHVACSIHRTSNSLTMGTTRLLEGLHLKKRLKRFIRKASIPSAESMG